MNTNLAPWARMGRAVEANSAQVAQQIAVPLPPAPVASLAQRQMIAAVNRSRARSTGSASTDVINPVSPALSVASSVGQRAASLGSSEPPKKASAAGVPKKASAAVPK